LKLVDCKDPFHLCQQANEQAEFAASEPNDGCDYLRIRRRDREVNSYRHSSFLKQNLDVGITQWSELMNESNL
jgi:hypothetical protein